MNQTFIATLTLVSVNSFLASIAQAQLKHRLPLDADTSVHFYYDHIGATGSALAWNGSSQTYDGHEGTDYTGADLPVFASAGGWIYSIRDGDPDTCDSSRPISTGNHVALYHDNGQQTLYWHFKNGSVTSKQVGEYVEAGEYLGITGCSGNATGRHLHYETREYNFETATWITFDPYDGYRRPYGGGSTWLRDANNQIATLNLNNPNKIEVGSEIEVFGLGTAPLRGRSSACGSEVRSHYVGEKGTVIAGPIYCSSYFRYQIRWENGNVDWVASLWCRKLMNAPSIVSVNWLRRNILPGEALVMEYTIYDPIGNSDVILGASFYQGGNIAFWDSARDRLVSVPQGYSSHSRHFSIPLGTNPGIYDGSAELWRDIDDDGSIDGSVDEVLSSVVRQDSLTVRAGGIGGSGLLIGEAYLATSSFEIDDDNAGGSQGDGDGIIEAGETIEVDLELLNVGEMAASDIVAYLEFPTGSGVTVTDDDLTFGIMEGGERKTRTDFDIQFNSPTYPTFLDGTIRIECSAGTFLSQIRFNIASNTDSTPPLLSVWRTATSIYSYDSNQSFDVLLGGSDSGGISDADVYIGYIGPGGAVDWRLKSSESFAPPLANLSGRYTIPALIPGKYLLSAKLIDGSGNVTSLHQDLGNSTLDPFQVIIRQGALAPQLPVLTAYSRPLDGFSWPATFSGYILTTSPDLANWSPVVISNTNQSGGMWRAVPVETNADRQYFRLKFE